MAATWDLHVVPDGCLLEEAPVCEEGKDDPKTCCGVNAMLQIIINVSQIVLSLTGSAALLMFVYGGIMFIIAGGAQDKISKAKDILKGSVIGIVIILCSWIIVNTVISALTDGKVTGGKLFGSQDWNKTP
ncbi:MAG: pilin [Patescibacteria group bacterium]|nr:pilin [Patescibacteria group bacterium]